MIDLTPDMIRRDIEKFKKRIKKATDALNNLPDHTYGWQAERDLNQKRDFLLSEIKHVERLIKIAKEAIQDK